MNNLESFPKSLIYLLTDGATTAENFHERKHAVLEIIKAAVENEIPLIQIREKKIPARMVYELAARAVAIAENSRTKILINDRADIALAANASGVHLTASSLPASVVRRSFPENFIVGVSAHTLEKAEAAKNQAADFVTFSPIFPSPGKNVPKGIERLKEVCERLNPFPVIALGGVDETNFQAVLKSGASGFAAIRFLNNANNLRRLKAEFNEKYLQ